MWLHPCMTLLTLISLLPLQFRHCFRSYIAIGSDKPSKCNWNGRKRSNIGYKRYKRDKGIGNGIIGLWLCTSVVGRGASSMCDWIHSVPAMRHKPDRYPVHSKCFNRPVVLILNLFVNIYNHATCKLHQLPGIYTPASCAARTHKGALSSQHIKLILVFLIVFSFPLPFCPLRVFVSIVERSPNNLG